MAADGFAPLSASIPPEELAQLAATSPDLHSAIAQHPNAYPELLEWLATFGDVGVEIQRASASDQSPSAPQPSASPLPAPLPSGSSGRTGRTRLMLIAGLAVLVVAILIGSLIAIQTPGYPDTAPYDRAQLLSMVRQLNDDPENRVWEGSRGSRADQSSLFAAVTPEGCGTIRAFGNSSFTAAEYSVSEDYDIRSSASGFGWLNARLFTSPEKALEYVAAVEEAVGRCPEFQSPEEEYQLNWASASWPSGAAGADYAFRYKAQERDSWSHYVLVVRENALFVVELGDSASPAQAGQFYRAVQELEIDERS